MSGDITEVAYESALRALDKQERVVEELRSRTGVLLAASSLAVTFLGRPLPANFAAVTVTFALGAFAATIGASVYILLPKSTFFFSVSGRAVLEELYDFRDDIAEIRRRLVYDMERFWYTNDRAMKPLFRAFRIAALGLVSEVALLLSTLSDILF